MQRAWWSLGFLLATTSSLFAQRDLKNVPDPDVEQERSTFVLPEGFEVNLYAADPQIAKPIQMNFDGQGRLWIASSEVYPQIKPGQKATDKILIVEDADGDGRADSTRVFADGLLIPTGVIPGDGGCYVANSTELIHLRDTNDDGKSDSSRVVLSGFGTEDTHHLLHTLRWGHDGCLYMNQSIYIHSHVETPYGVKRLNGGGIWRFRPETLELDVLAYGFVNTWGHHFDRWGQSFATDGAYGEGINYVFPGSVFVTAPGATRIMNGLNPGSPKHCGLEILSGDHLPADWQGSMITNDFRAHRVCRFTVTDDGSGHASRQETEVIKSKHPAFRPIDVKMGPDGAIYIADWYNPIIQHGEVDFRDERRDHTHGRIWRVSAKERPALKTAIPADAAPADLLKRLTANEEWVRLWAKLQLKAHGAEKSVPEIAKWVAAIPRGTADAERLRLEGLWAYQTVNYVEPQLLGELLASPEPRVRAAAVRVASQWRTRYPSAFASFKAAANDEHPRVRLEAVRALVDFPTLEAVSAAAQALDRPLDKNLDFALWKTMRELGPVWIPALKEGKFDFGGNVDHLTFALKSSDSGDIVGPLLQLVSQDKLPTDRVQGVLQLAASLGGPKELGTVLERVLAVKEPGVKEAAILTTLAEAAYLRKAIPTGDLTRLATLMSASDANVQAAAFKACGAWKVPSLRETLLARAADSSASDTLRAAAIEALGEYPDPALAGKVREFTSDGHPPRVRIAAVSVLAKKNVNAAAATVALLTARTSDEVELTAAVNALTAQKAGPAAFAKALEGQSLPGDNAKMVLRIVRNGSQASPELEAAIRKAGSLGESAWKFTPELTAALVTELRSQGNAARGEVIYRRKEMQCAKCHAVAGAGGVVGPGLESIGASAQDDYLVEAILAPAAKVKEGFHSKTVAVDDGRVITGIPVRETKTELVLRDAEDRVVTLPKDRIEETKDGRSLMPEGLVNDLTRGELVDLLRFLSELGEVGGEYAVGKTRLVRRYQTLPWSTEAHKKMNRTSYDSAAGDDPDFVWESAYSRVSGELDTADLAKYVVHKGNDPTSFVRFQVEVTTPGKAKLLLNDPIGLALWIDGKPSPLAAENLIDLASGKHTFTLAANQTQRKSPLRVELQDAPGSAAQVQIVGGK